jgi:ribonuclease E
MPKRMLINARHAEESRVAILADDKLVDFATETATKNQNKGNIYRGIVSKVERSLGAAFVDYGVERHGFLPFGEINLDVLEDRGNRREGTRVEDLLRPKMPVLVQVVKEEISTKGAALSTYISLPGRYLVLMPGTDTGGVSRKIEDEEQRRRLRETVAQLKPPPGLGIIVRTAGLDRNRIELQKDLQYLLRVWKEIEDRYAQLEGAGLVHREPELPIRILRDYFSPDVEEVLIDNKEVYQKALDFFHTFMPRSQIALKLYQGTRPLFSLYEVEEQVASIYQRKVTLNAGGTILVDPTEALVAIDVNSGKATQEKGREETAYRVNLEAADEIARQIRLRDLGGLIVIDFIDMRDRKHMRDVERRFRNAVKDDKARVKVGKLSGFGLLEMSRQRLRPDYLDQSHRACPTCQGARLVPTPENQALTALRKMHEAAAQGDLAEVRGSLMQDGLLYLLNNKRQEVLRLEMDYNVKVTLGVARSPEDVRLDFVKRELRMPEEERARQAPRPRPPVPRPPEPAAPDAVHVPESSAEDVAPVSAEAGEGKRAEPPSIESGPGAPQPPGEKRRRRRRRRGRRRKRMGEGALQAGASEGGGLAAPPPEPGATVAPEPAGPASVPEPSSAAVAPDVPPAVVDGPPPEPVRATAPEAPPAADAAGPPRETQS